jgi:HSP20 family protein
MESLGVGGWTPRVESLHKNGSYVIKADLPGVNPKDIHVTLEGERLIIEGERKMDREMKRKDFRRREVFYGAFRRSVPIPRGLKAEGIKAKYHDGVLEITAPVEKGYLPKEVKVEVEKVA